VGVKFRQDQRQSPRANHAKALEAARSLRRPGYHIEAQATSQPADTGELRNRSSRSAPVIPRCGRGLCCATEGSAWNQIFRSFHVCRPVRRSSRLPSRQSCSMADQMAQQCVCGCCSGAAENLFALGGHSTWNTSRCLFRWERSQQAGRVWRSSVTSSKLTTTSPFTAVPGVIVARGQTLAGRVQAGSLQGGGGRN